MNKVVDKNECTGCTACKQVCPVQAITMKDDGDGFLYSVIDQEKCIDCGLCVKTCPVLKEKNKKSVNECYVGYSKNDEDKENTSSGGLFPVIANYILDNSGIVIGAAFNENNKLNHIAISKKSELTKLKGSKYLQSNVNDIFPYIKENVENNKILFVGTPCQVSGLKSYLKKDYDNLLCIDLICHGVPSPKLFDKYISELEQENNDKVVNYDFRDKSTGWTTYSNTITFTNGKKTELHTKNNYMKLFLSDIALRESCYDCNFKLGNKYSDITLGDFWGVENYYPKMNNTKGVSAIIVNTNKGREVFNIIKNDLIYNVCKLEEILEKNPSLKISANYPKKRTMFFEELNYKSTEYLVNKYKNKLPLYKRILKKIKNTIKFNL